MKETLVLQDEQNRTLTCEILKEIFLDDTTYLVVAPVDHPIRIFVWDQAADTHSSAMDDEEEAEISDIDELDREDEAFAVALPTAQAVLAELNLTLRQSAYILTVQGELPEPDQEDIIELVNEEEDVEEYQLLTTFFQETLQYSICTPIDPLWFFAVQPEQGDPYLLLSDSDESQDLLERLQDQLLDLAE
jgi:hypothetical protein